MIQGSYASGTAELPLLGMIIGERLDQVAAHYPSTDALVSVRQGTRWTYEEFLHRTEHVAASLLSLGVEKGDRVPAPTLPSCSPCKPRYDRTDDK
jgi:fatty-acyl-CoA synthase